MIVKEDFTAVGEDGITLKGVLLIPEQAKAVIQFNCGTGTKKEFYLPFLNYLCEHGYICCLWDYRGSGQSAPLEMKNCDYRYADYGVKDMPVIKSFLEKKYPELPFLLVGHSTGGQQIGLMSDLDNVKGNINFAVSAGYYPKMPFAYRMKAYFYFYLFSPVSVALNGYVKAKDLGLMENLPQNVVYEWRDWLEKEDYFFDEKFYGKTVPVGHYKNFRFPIHTYWTTDDTISNEKNTEAFWRNVKGEKEITFTKLTPQEYGLSKIDHFGFFKKGMKDKLWLDVVKRLDGFLNLQ